MQVAESNESAVAEIWQRYFPRLVAVANRTFRYVPGRSEDARDIAQSAFVAFWQQMTKEGFAASLDRNSLWSLLTTITVRKVRGQLRTQSAQKRGGGKVKRFSELGEDSTLSMNDALSIIPAQEFDMACEEWLSLLPEDHQQFAILRLLGHTNREISEMLDCTERKVERKLKRIRQLWHDGERV